MVDQHREKKEEGWFFYVNFGIYVLLDTYTLTGHLRAISFVISCILNNFLEIHDTIYFISTKGSTCSSLKLFIFSIDFKLLKYRIPSYTNY